MLISWLGPADSASTNVVADEVYLQLSSKKKLQDDAEDGGDKTIEALRAALAKRALKLQSGDAGRIGGDAGGRIASGVYVPPSPFPVAIILVSMPVSFVLHPLAWCLPRYVAPANRRKNDEGDVEGGPAGKAAYVPPSMRPGRGGSAPGGGDSMYQRDDTATLRVTNISENTQEEDLRELFRPFGPISRCYLAKDKVRSPRFLQAPLVVAVAFRCCSLCLRG